MTGITLEIGKLLHEPVSVELLRFLPKAPKPRNERDQENWYCLAVPYYEFWYLIDLLNTHLYGQWQISDQQIVFSEQDNRVIVCLTMNICGISFAGVGEEFLGSDTQVDENAITAAWGQAVRRTCALVGLGTGAYFLPDLPSRFVAYDPKEKRMLMPDEARLRLARELYAKTPDALLRGMVGVEGHDLLTLEAAIKRPFAVQQIDFLQRPNSVRYHEDGSSTCEANPYVDVWSLIRRLNASCFGLWNVPSAQIKIARNTVIVTVWVKIGSTCQPGVWQEPLIVTGKPGKPKPVADAVTTAYSYAFKRACHALNLGTYLRFLPPPTVPYDPERRRIAKRSLDIARAMYQTAGLPLESGELTGEESDPSLCEDSALREADERLRASIAEQLKDEPARVRALCSHYHVSSLDDLSSTQLVDVDQRLKAEVQPGSANEKQMNALRILSEHSNEGIVIPPREKLSYREARRLIRELEALYKGEATVPAAQESSPV